MVEEKICRSCSGYFDNKLVAKTAITSPSEHKIVQLSVHITFSIFKIHCIQPLSLQCIYAQSLFENNGKN